MYKKLAELKVNTLSDYYDKVVKALQKEGFILVLELETLSDRYFIVAEREDKDEISN